MRQRLYLRFHGSAKISTPRAMGQYWPHEGSGTPPLVDCEVHFFDFSTAVRGGSMGPSKRRATHDDSGDRGSSAREQGT